MTNRWMIAYRVVTRNMNGDSFVTEGADFINAPTAADALTIFKLKSPEKIPFDLKYVEPGCDR